MRIELEPSLQRWIDAKLVDSQQAGQILQYETAQAPAATGVRWPVAVALVFGGVMLAAGVLLFVSAHWDQLSPFERMSLLVLTVSGFHVAGAYSSARFPALGTTLHTVGTIALGGAIFLAGQIFNMEEHWPTGVLLWTLGAFAGWFLLRDWPQLTLAAMLAPFYLVGEWTEAAKGLRSLDRVPAAGLLLLAICYLSARRSQGDDDGYVRISLAWLGGLSLVPLALATVFARSNGTQPDQLLDATGWAAAILIPLAVAFIFRGTSAWMNLVAAMWVIALSWAGDRLMEKFLYVWCIIGAAAMIAWGVHEYRAERINLGMAGFALTIVFFFFSSVMDKLGRAASLISLGVVFLAGGWLLEKLRRRLVSLVHLGGAQ